MLSIYSTLCLVFLLINEIDQLFFVKMPIQHSEAVFFIELICFFAWLAGRFHNCVLTQNSEKARNVLKLSLTIDETET
jgi:hypothetical protein